MSRLDSADGLYQCMVNPCPHELIPKMAHACLQVSHAGPPVPYRNTFQVEPPTPRPTYSWRSRLQSLICCFGIPNQGYVRDTDSGAGAGTSAARVQQPPIPPKLARERENLIGPIREEDAHKKTLVLDLDETLVHSSFKPIPSASVSRHA